MISVRRYYRLVVCILIVLCLNSIIVGAQENSAIGAMPAVADALIAARLGIAHIASAETPPDDTRYQNALSVGASWNRFPMYWNRVEISPGVYDWSDYDRVIADHVRFGLQMDIILLGIPQFYQENNIVTGLHASVFTDGSDRPKEQVAINPANPWARFVHEAVNRYKSGGLLAQQNGWQSGQPGIVWEVWNEPDFRGFWEGRVRDYARLLKAGYLAAHHADPNALVMFGGLLYNTEDNWLARVLAIYTDDALAQEYNYFMDIVGVHAYSYPWRSGWLVLYVRDTLRAYGLQRPIWLNETGVPIWDDYPGPVWATTLQQRLNMATAQQQAWFLIQSAAYAWAQGADRVFYHQLYDDCGDQPAGTDFPPHNGELCLEGQLCSGSSFGLFRNNSDSVCFSQHPFPGTPRPAAKAFRLLADVFAEGDFGRGDIERINGITSITFERPTTQELIHVIWNRRFEPNTHTLVASGTAARLYTLENPPQTLTPDNQGNYVVNLFPALPDNYTTLEHGDDSAIGGSPVILVEAVNGELPPLPESPTILAVSPPTLKPPQPDVAIVASQLTPIPTQPVLPPPPPPVAAEDTTPPTATVEALPDISPLVFTVRWTGEDASGIEKFIIWVRINGGEWQPWLETSRNEAYFTGTSGNFYEFAAWSLDFAGNWSPNIDLTPQAQTQVQ